MKKLLLALLTVGVSFIASSCHKCGYCRETGGYNSSSTCQTTSIPGIPSDYDEAKSDCASRGGTWVLTK